MSNNLGLDMAKDCIPKAHRKKKKRLIAFNDLRTKKESLKLRGKFKSEKAIQICFNKAKTICNARINKKFVLHNIQFTYIFTLTVKRKLVKLKILKFIYFPYT